MVAKINSKKDKKSVMIGKLKFENYKNCLKGTTPENKMKYLEKIRLT